MINVLLTSVGRRSYLVEYFKQAVRGEGKVICANMYADSAGMFVADEAIVVPPSHDAAYIPTILELCREHQIKLITSFHDLDVYILSQHLDELRQVGTIPILPDAKWGRLTLDKYECSHYLQQRGFDIPWTGISLDDAIAAIHAGELCFPVLIKARMGFGSLGLHRCYSLDELRSAYENIQRQIDSSYVNQYAPLPPEQSVLIQQLVDGKEYCVDIVNDLNGQYVSHFVCEIHSMRAGESDRATTVDPAVVGDLPNRLSALTRHLGLWEVDCMDDGGVLRVIDVNPRFAGDYPFNHIAGANIPAALIAWVKGESPEPEWFRSIVGVSGYKDLVPKLGAVN
jgi:carbamoyl-phosphate synthase large subunit